MASVIPLFKVDSIINNLKHNHKPIELCFLNFGILLRVHLWFMN